MKVLSVAAVFSALVGAASADTAEPSFSMAPSVPTTAEPSFSMMPTKIEHSPPGTCEERKICEYFDTTPDGTKVPHGAYVSREWYSLGFYITATSEDGGYTPDGKARIMDTAHPGSDIDLGSPNGQCPHGGPGVGVGGKPGMPGENCNYEGNVLIIQEETDRDVDDNAYGGSMTFSFTKSVDVLRMGIMDLESSDTAELSFSYYGGKSPYTEDVTGLGDNSVQTISIGQDNVKTMTYSIPHSGAIRYICYCDSDGGSPPLPAPTKPPALTPTKPPTTTPTVPAGEICVDFSETALGHDLDHGDYVSTEWLPWGVKITVYPGEGGYAPGHKGRIMDTAHPGSDEDLGSPNGHCPGGGPGVGTGGEPGMPGENCDYEGNVLIIQEETDRDVDDNAEGGSIKFQFSYAATLKKMGLMDLDEGVWASLDVKKADGYWHPNIPIEGLGDNSVQDVTFDLGSMPVASLQLNIAMSGAVRYICYELDLHAPLA